MRSDSRMIETANLVLGSTDSRHLPRIAKEWLRQGYDSPSLRILAGLMDNDIERVLPIFEKAVKELGWPLPSRLEAVFILSRQIAGQILSGEIQPYDGSKRIWDLTLQLDGPPPVELHTFIYAASEWDERPEDRPHFERGVLDEARALIGTK